MEARLSRVKLLLFQKKSHIWRPFLPKASWCGALILATFSSETVKHTILTATFSFAV
jgi:hypothetical protein